MKPITHPLAVAFVEERAAGRSGPKVKAWTAAGMPLYDDADANPMPAPALGMRAWYSRPLSREGERESDSREVSYARPGLTWHDFVGEYRVPDIDIITDFRTGEVLWRRDV